MSHSLRAKIKCLRYKGIITDKDCDRLCKALDNENVLDQIRAEITEYKDDQIIHAERNEMIDIVLEIIDKYRNEVSE